MTEESIKEAAQFSNFAQRIKMKYWKQGNASLKGWHVPENALDEILLLAWQEHKTTH